MRILLIMDPGIAVPPKNYGGHERLVYMFANEYVRLGHHVTLLAGPDSYCDGNTITFGINDLQRSKRQIRQDIRFVWKYLTRHHSDYDLIHNFGRLIYLLPALNKSLKKIMTYGRPVSHKGIRIFSSLPNKNLIFTACSNYCVGTGDVAGKWETVYNAIDFSQYDLNRKVDAKAPLMFLGRLDKIKGVHTAIEAAKATGRRLIIAGNIPNTADNYEYFKKDVEPLIDGDYIRYVGELDDAGKNEYLRQAAALLFPIEWDEPFGIVMIEAMACGTPVVGFRKGSVPEVVQEAVNGFIVSNAEEMIEAIAKLPEIDRRACRESAEIRFDVKLIAKQYLQLFE